MKPTSQRTRNILLATIPVIAIFFCAWNNPGKEQIKGPKLSVKTDTIPLNNNDKSNDINININIDKALKAVDESMAKLDVQLKNVDVDKQVNDALASIDFNKINQQVQESLKNIDWDKMKVDIDNSLDEAKEQIKNIDVEKLKAETQKMQEQLNSKEFKDEINGEKLKKEIEDGMNSAKQGLQKAKEALQKQKAFTDELQRDGLIDKNKSNSIEWKHGNLYINGKEQPKSVSDKYRKYENNEE